MSARSDLAIVGGQVLAGLEGADIAPALRPANILVAGEAGGRPGEGAS